MRCRIHIIYAYLLSPTWHRPLLWPWILWLQVTRRKQVLFCRLTRWCFWNIGDPAISQTMTLTLISKVYVISCLKCLYVLCQRKYHVLASKSLLTCVLTKCRDANIYSNIQVFWNWIFTFWNLYFSVEFIWPGGHQQVLISFSQSTLITVCCLYRWVGYDACSQ